MRRLRRRWHVARRRLRAFAPQVGDDVHQVLTAEGSVASRKHIGGTAPEAVLAAIARARKRLA